MFSRIQNQFGTAGLIVAVVALVAALGGGAYAASNGLNGKQKKQVKNISKSEAKKVVKQMAKSGPAGPQGAAGAPGKDGTNGTNGTNGKDGTNGATGKSVEVGTEPANTANCSGFGGATVQVAGEPATKKIACNGKTGFTDTLPSGKTETGVWDVNTTEPAIRFATMSYAIPLEAAPATVTVVQEGETGVTGCPGSETIPTAEPGFLCVYVLQTNLAAVNAFPALNTAAGASLGVSIFVEGGGFARGTWAVTAE